MIKLTLVNNKFEYEIGNIIRLFFPDEKILSTTDESCFCDIIVSIDGNKHSVKFIQNDNIKEKNDVSEPSESEQVLSCLLYEILSEYTGFRPAWGIQTGIRPVKLLRDLSGRLGNKEALNFLNEKFFVSPKKLKLAEKTMVVQNEILDSMIPNSFSLYVSIPFCPSRCSYCSFISHDVEKMKKLIPDYIIALISEIKETARIANKLSLRLQTVYIGGGTPTVLEAEDLALIMDTIVSCFDISNLCEFTVEAGRPDTITKEKLLAIKAGGATRISINPQTLNDQVLKNIRRNHTKSDFLNAYSLAAQCGFDNINTDLIAGLPGDTNDSFENTIDEILELSPASITVHTLSVKRSSRMVYTGKAVYSASNIGVCEMLNISAEKLIKAEYQPYYLYKQSRTLGNNENTGWAKPGYYGLYNIFIMEEKQTILAVGAGASIKLVKDGKIERIFNYKFPYEYLNGFDEIIKRKQAIETFYNMVL